MALLLLVAVFSHMWSYALTPPVSTPIVNRATVSYADANGNLLPEVSATVQTLLSGAPVLTISIISGSDPVAPGEPLTYRIIYQNTGNAPASNVTVEDQLWDFVIFQSASDSGGYNASNHIVEWSLGTVEPGESGELSITVLVKEPDDYPPGDPDVIGPGSLIYNTAVIESDEDTSDDTIVTTVGESSNLEISMNVSSPVVSPGGMLTYTIDYRNIGNRDAAGVSIRNELPSGTAYIEGSLTGEGTLDNREITWYIGEVPAGEQGSVSYEVRVSPIAEAGTVFRNISTISSRDQGVIVSNETITQVSAHASLSVTKLDRPDPVYVGNQITYTILLENEGVIPLTGITVTDIIPDHTTFISADNGGLLTGNILNWNIDYLAPGEEMALELVVQVDFDLAEGDIIENTASAVSNEISIPSETIVTTVSERTPGAVKFYDHEWNRANVYSLGDEICMEVTDFDQNMDPAAAENVNVILASTGNDDSEAVLLAETETNTGVFRNCITSTGDITTENDGFISLSEDSSITVTYTDLLDASSVSLDAALIDPFGIIFDSITGDPVSGTTVILIDTSTNQPADLSASATGLSYDQDSTVITGEDGEYAFRLVPPGSYYLSVEPGTGYTFPSAVSDTDLPDGFVIGTGSRGEIFTLSPGDPPLNLDIPVDPPPGNITVIKTANKTSASIGDIVIYTITISNDKTTAVTNLDIMDILPHGFQYLKNSTMVSGEHQEDPWIESNRTIFWNIDEIDGGESVELTYRTVIGPDSPKGDGENRVTVQGNSAERIIRSNTAKHKIDITEGIFTDKGTIIGKVFLDLNKDGIQESPDENKDSGIKDSKSLNTAEEYGIANVVLFMEDGTRVTTDSNGKFFIPGVRPGTHVLRIDETTLPGHLTPYPSSNRFMGDLSSQFVDMSAGQLYKANFALVGTDDDKNIKPIQNQTQKTDKKRIQGADSEIKSSNEAEPEPGSMEWLTEQSSTKVKGLDILAPLDGEVLPKAATDIIIKVPFDVKLQVWVNDKEIGNDRIGSKIVNNYSKVAVYEYISLPLDPLKSNAIRARVTDPFGNVRGEKEISVSAAGPPFKIDIKPDENRIPADGKYITPVTVTVLDEKGAPAFGVKNVNVSLQLGEILEEDADPVTEGYQIPCRGGVARFNIKSPHETGESDITVSVDSVENSITLFFEPHLRNMIIVGMGEIQLGRGKTNGSDRFLNNTSVEDGTYTKSQGSVFVKGEIFRDILLTASYDSEKEKQEDFFRAADKDLESEARYPVSGDESKLGYEAYSRKKLYMRLEKDKSHVMFGDFHTEFNDSRLSAYTRTFTGLKTEINTDKVKLRGFISDSDQVQVIDEIRGRGVSGYYQLRYMPVVYGSETVTIETRDRYRPDRVINRESVSRWKDYSIDYSLGTLLFKSPVQSYDSNFNPVYIIVSYESETAGEKNYTYGGRGEFSLTDRARLGFTGFIEEKDGDNYSLIGTDLTLNLPGDTVLRAEWARTSSALDERSSMESKEDDAWLFELESRPVRDVDLEAYYKYTGDYFDNISAVDIYRGTTHYGASAIWNPVKDLIVRAQHFDENDRLNDGTYRHTSLGLIKSFEKTRLSLDISREDSDDNYMPTVKRTSRESFDISEETPEDLISVKLGVETELTSDLTLDLGHRQDIAHNNYNLSHAGLKYKITENSRIYLREEYGKFDDRKETRTLLGAETQIGKNSTVYNEYRLENGADGQRNHQVIGLNNKFRLGEKTTGNISVEHLKTLKGVMRNTQPDAYGIAMALEYLPRNRIKLSTRLEYRKEDTETGRQSWLGEIGTAVKLSNDYTLLFKERYFQDDYNQKGMNIASRSIMSLAYRPVRFDRLNAFAKLEYEYEKDSTSITPFKQDTLIASLEGIYQYNRKTQLAGKYASKLIKDGGFSNLMDMISGKIIYDINDRFDFGAEYRLLKSHDADAYKHGGSVEAGYKVVKNVWLTLGYKLDKYSNDLGLDNYQGKGPYVKIRLKFAEALINKVFKKK
ncbi:hypothetical protein ACFL1N_01480 [Thermodesulfobacteriota bacterium]